MNFTLITALLICSFSKYESETMNAQPGQEVTLQCSNISKHETTTSWFRLVNRTKASCISVMIRSNGSPSYCNEIKTGKFEMSTNISTVSLKISHVDVSDSGLYFCGFRIDGHIIYSVIQLNVGADECDPGWSDHSPCDGHHWSSSFTFILLTYRTTSTHFVLLFLQNLGSDDLNYAAVTFCPKQRRGEVEPNVVYSATR
uniref:Ig-like domain-containing protein n=1 Tax=Lates calcarifer TaxID=8187 RepID=A0A4W6CWP6_LATCA